ncbi:hypothetical protein ANCCAN_12267 [Ancylostoma caninum]|uniref:Cysteine/serine-rich nuclear protein N-terminal domain-containing protein n=1 Tax=Ancylostoma caninum TaxID=29170 RepID=A0A368GBN5_ANCCA|nr:hypothetical protein ANCCAN_12267 [Ancylostoma caninum]
MDDAMRTAGSSSTTCDTSTAPRPVQQNRVPIWKRHVFPDSPAVNADPFELPPNLTPALKRVRSRTKLPAKGSGITSSLSRLPSSSECGASSAVPPFPVRSSPRKKPPSPIPSKTDQCLDVRVEGKADSESARGDTQRAISGSADGRPSSQTPSRVRDSFYPISLPPKKPRLAFMPVSTSDLRPPRKPIMVEPDYQQLPSSSTTLSRLPKALRHSSVNLRTMVEKDIQEQRNSQNDLVQPSTESAGSSRLFHSRSTMNLRLTPERDMRERRRSGAENTAMTTPRASPKKKLQSSATVSDLRQTMLTPTRRGRRISLSETDSKRLPPKPLRKRSSSLEVRGVKTNTAALCRKKKLNENKPREDQGLPHSPMQSSTNPVAEVSIVAKADTIRRDLAEGIKSVSLECSPDRNSEEFSTIPTADKISINTDTSGDAAIPEQPPTAQDASNGSSRECAISSSQIPQKIVGPENSSVDASTEDACPAQSSLEELKEEGNSSSEEKSSSSEMTVASNSNKQQTGELKQEDDSTEDNLPSEGVAAASNEQEIVMEVEEKPSVSKAVEMVAQDDATLASSDVHSNAEGDRNSDLTNEQLTNDMGPSATCHCSQEASSSTSACQAEEVSEDGQGSAASQPNFSISAPCMTRNSSLKSVKSEPSLDKRVRFQNVHVFYFARTQGMSTVPKSGEVSLGMVDKHFTKRQFPLWFGRRPELTLPNDYEEELSEDEDPGDVFDPEGLERCTAHQLPLFEGKARIKMLKRSGVQVQKDGNVESLESIRQSRILCGCQCERGLCKPETCQCSLDGIGCQVDGPDEFGKSHPCSCTAATCLNPCGRVEFDPDHVKNHFRITMMRLKHAEQKGMYDSPQRIRFTSEGEPESVSHFTPPPQRSMSLNGTVTPCQKDGSANGMDEPLTRKFPVTPVYKKSKQKRGLRVDDPDAAALIKVKTKLSWEEPLESDQDQKIASSAVNQY